MCHKKHNKAIKISNKQSKKVYLDFQNIDTAVRRQEMPQLTELIMAILRDSTQFSKN